MTGMWKVVAVVIAAVAVGGYLISSAMGEQTSRPDPGPPVVLTETPSTGTSPTLKPDRPSGKPDGPNRPDQQGKPAQPNSGQAAPDDDDDDDEVYPEVEDDDDADDDAGGDDG